VSALAKRMTAWQRVLLAVVLVLAVIACIDVAQNKRTQLWLFHPKGSITQGSVLGVAVGDRWEKADRTLHSLFSTHAAWEAKACSDTARLPEFTYHPILNGPAVVRYRDHSWQNGVIYLCLSDGVVTGISWKYGLPVDL
jgi:hypothetical protein